MKRKKINISFDELPEGASYIAQEVVSAFQTRLSETMETVNNEFIKKQKVTADHSRYIAVS
jgi:hypothetical protein